MSFLATGCSDNHCSGFVFLLFENRSVNVQIHPKRFAKKYSCLYFIRGHSKFTERRREEERGGGRRREGEGGGERGREGERGGGRGVICSGQAYRSGELTVFLLALSCKTLAEIWLCKIHVILGLKVFFYYYFLDSPRSESNMNDMNTHWQSLDRR